MLVTCGIVRSEYVCAHCVPTLEVIQRHGIVCVEHVCANRAMGQMMSNDVLVLLQVRWTYA